MRIPPINGGARGPQAPKFGENMHAAMTWRDWRSGSIRITGAKRNARAARKVRNRKIAGAICAVGLTLATLAIYGYGFALAQ